jgi:hypothetical protein
LAFISFTYYSHDPNLSFFLMQQDGWILLDKKALWAHTDIVLSWPCIPTKLIEWPLFSAAHSPSS